MAGQLDGKVAVITGGGNGIGRAAALRFLAEGARVVIGDLNAATGNETVDLARQAGYGERISFVHGDVTQEADVEAMITAAPRVFGRLDCVFNNAGISGAFGPITHIDAADWDYTFAVLVRAVFLGMKHGVRVMRAQNAKGQGEGGSFVNTASVAGLSGGDAPQAYSAAKAAVINLTRAAAVELAPQRIRVNAICPGAILTPLVHRGSPEAMEPMLAGAQPWPEAGRPEHIAAAALFLSSDDARFITGEALVVDGGLTAAGSNAMEKLGMRQQVQIAVGVDHGTTGRDPTLRSVE